MRRTRTYNIVVKEWAAGPKGELRTDKELARWHRRLAKKDWPETRRIKVYVDSIYFFFGARFGESAEFEPNGYSVAHTNVFIQIDSTDSQARYKVAEKVSPWQAIKTARKDGRNYIRYNNARIYLDEVERLH